MALEVGHFRRSGVEVVEGCHQVWESPPHGDTWFAVVVRVQPDQVDEYLQIAGVDAHTATGSPDGAVNAGLVDFSNVRFAQPDEEWTEGDVLSYNDRVRTDGTSWSRYVSWGAEVDGESYLIRLQLER